MSQVISRVMMLGIYIMTCVFCNYCRTSPVVIQHPLAASILLVSLIIVCSSSSNWCRCRISPAHLSVNSLYVILPPSTTEKWADVHSGFKRQSRVWIHGLTIAANGIVWILLKRRKLYTAGSRSCTTLVRVRLVCGNGWSLERRWCSESACSPQQAAVDEHVVT